MGRKAVEDKRNKLAVMATRGTDPERQVAAEKLKSLGGASVPAVVTEEVGDRWTGQGVLTRHKNGAKAHLKGAAVKHFVRHVDPNGCILRARDVPMSDDFGQGDFYMMVGWLSSVGLCRKLGERYSFSPRRQIVAAWNDAVEAMKL